MKKVEIDPVLIILGIIAALIVGIVTGAVSVGKFLIKKFKQLIVELRVAHKKELSDVKNESDKHIKHKNETIFNQQKIIDDLLDLFYVKDEKGKCLVDTTIGRHSYNQIVKQRARIN